MDETILKTADERLSRRSFLRGSSLLAAAIGVAALPARAGTAQDVQKPSEPAPDGQKDDDKKDGEEQDPFKVTKIDEQGRPYRLCPQCGYNMYKQDRTWTCENCGYSYEE
jgi:ribosomal protein S27AE